MCKAFLQQRFNLPLAPKVPLVGWIGRLDYQKGPDLLLDALPAFVNLDCQVGGGEWQKQEWGGMGLLGGGGRVRGIVDIRRVEGAKSEGQGMWGKVLIKSDGSETC